MKVAFGLAAGIVIAASPALAQSSRKAKAQHSPQVQSYGGYGGQKRTPILTPMFSSS
jgi:hypothetical protein